MVVLMGVEHSIIYQVINKLQSPHKLTRNLEEINFTQEEVIRQLKIKLDPALTTFKFKVLYKIVQKELY